MFYFVNFFQLLLNDSKSNANAKGFGAYTPLHIAAQMDSVDICKRLVRNYRIFRQPFNYNSQQLKTKVVGFVSLHSKQLNSIFKPLGHYERIIKS